MVLSLLSTCSDHTRSWKCGYTFSPCTQWSAAFPGIGTRSPGCRHESRERAVTKRLKAGNADSGGRAAGIAEGPGGRRDETAAGLRWEGVAANSTVSRERGRRSAAGHGPRRPQGPALKTPEGRRLVPSAGGTVARAAWGQGGGFTAVLRGGPRRPSSGTSLVSRRGSGSENRETPGR